MPDNSQSPIGGNGPRDNIWPRDTKGTQALATPEEIRIQCSDGGIDETALTKAARRMGIAWVAE